MPPIFIPPRPVVGYRHTPVRAPAHLPRLRPQRLPGQSSNNGYSAGQRIQQMQNQARLHKEIMHGFFESLARLMEQLKDAL